MEPSISKKKRNKYFKNLYIYIDNFYFYFLFFFKVNMLLGNIDVVFFFNSEKTGLWVHGNNAL